MRAIQIVLIVVGAVIMPLAAAIGITEAAGVGALLVIAGLLIALVRWAMSHQAPVEEDDVEWDTAIK